MNKPLSVLTIAGATVLMLTASHASAQSGVDAAGPGAVDASVAMGARDTDGRVVVRAQPLGERMAVDGKLDESLYRQFRPVSGFVQAEPNRGEAATEQTQMWVFFDDRAIYIGLRCLDSATDRWGSLDMRRDSPGFGQTESVSVGLDPFFDRRNGLIFGVNAVGGFSDSAITNERDSNRDWNTIWDARVGRFDGGWTVEMEIPFKSLRYARANRCGASTCDDPYAGKMRCRISPRCRTRDRIPRNRVCSGFRPRPR